MPGHSGLWETYRKAVKWLHTSPSKTYIPLFCFLFILVGSSQLFCNQADTQVFSLLLAHLSINTTIFLLSYKRNTRLGPKQKDNKPQCPSPLPFSHKHISIKISQKKFALCTSSPPLYFLLFCHAHLPPVLGWDHLITVTI